MKISSKNIKITLVSISILMAIQIISYNTIGKNSIQPIFLGSEIEIPEIIDSVSITNGIFAWCGNDLSSYYNLNLEQDLPIIKEKLNAKHYEFVNARDFHKQSLECSYRVFSVENEYLYFTNNVSERLSYYNWFQSLNTKYIWILFKWFKIDSEYYRKVK